MTTPATAAVRAQDRQPTPREAPTPAGRRRSAVKAVGPILAALGVVFGDIGTSPIYAASTTFGIDTRTTGGPAPEFVLGATSTLIWSLFLVVTVLYVRFLLRTDNRGEGGLLALFGLLRRSSLKARTVGVFTVVAMFGAAMFLGDSVITPAISVLSAVEGLEVVQPGFARYVVPAAFVILLGVFALQKFGSNFIGRLYGPVMILWFAALAVSGAASLGLDPSVLQALSPTWVVRFFVDQPGLAFLALGAVVLAVTGAEALYSDLGHFGRRAITRAWLFVVFPALVLNYLGQASLALREPSKAGTSFFGLVPSWALVPMVVLATLATIIASQAVISGTFSVIHQAGHLGVFPRVKTVHTSSESEGQIYMPAITILLAVAVLGVVVGFRSSASLASAYGIAVTATISITSIIYLAFSWARGRRWTLRMVVVSAILVLVLAFLGGNLPKITSGGWLPLTLGAVAFVVMATSWVGLRRIAAGRRLNEMPLDELPALLGGGGAVHRVPGDAVFITRSPGVVPIALRTMVTQNHALQERAILLSYKTVDVPTTRGLPHRISVTSLGDGIVQVTAKVGYRESPQMTALLTEAAHVDDGCLDDFAASRAVFFISTPVPRYNRGSRMLKWAQMLFLAMDRLAPDPLDVIALPRDRTIVVGREVPL
ncbi:KUP/HAK/KT family potassium transporter [Frondihabitans australicus]|uniref:Probable potassium transport system protein Kup n=1 Tax=Frondihabitans australicus TaxID=386892 RepID=A0A495IL05_9MICO|nr:KUP/HAK/KT family potassium transporter [Frondihabitans australicus]RKR75961.1 KUP system potassium uptake protein [Frondihabitans australicus]